MEMAEKRPETRCWSAGAIGVDLYWHREADSGRFQGDEGLDLDDCDLGQRVVARGAQGICPDLVIQHRNNMVLGARGSRDEMGRRLSSRLMCCSHQKVQVALE